MKVKVRAISNEKIKVIKNLRAAFGLSLKGAKDLADGMMSGVPVVYEDSVLPSVKDLNTQCGKDNLGNVILEFLPATLDRPRLLERLRVLASTCLRFGEPTLAEDLLHVYNKHLED